MADATALQLVEEIAKGLQVSRNVNYAYLASYMIVYFDWLLVSESEIRLVWNAEGVKMKVLYSLTRYLPIIYFPLLVPYHFQNGYTDSECATLYKVISASFMIATHSAALVVTIRTWAVWGKAKYMTYILFGTYAVVFALILVFYIISLKYTSHPEVFRGFPFGCVPKYTSRYLPAALMVEAVYDTVITALMLIRGISLYQWGKNSRLFQTLYRDGIVFYVCITVVSIANVVLSSSRPLQGNYYVLLLTMQGGVRSVLACRIILHIRMQYDALQTNILPRPVIKSDRTTVLIERSAIELRDG
ncbi:hypothetical protein Agabi119p4_4242 [Agaricus bisporus var. burnettii]|uniref:DUF6533 domain-containing protein n=1 Tax=Agaricus bisporus var. burnettii TaxID=192524 RepID=A0A8H7F2Y8_AGABI|nr:hypothetical protein Agabi119p4_4242 [Agaricus bisporus var. burnettii]